MKMPGTQFPLSILNPCGQVQILKLIAKINWRLKLVKSLSYATPSSTGRLRNMYGNAGYRVDQARRDSDYGCYRHRQETVYYRRRISRAV